jgi:hypothetical protein
MMRRRDQSPTPPPLRLADLDLAEILALTSGWAPPTAVTAFDRERWPRWPNWSAFLADYRAVRTELFGEFPDRPARKPFFGERVMQYVDRHGIDALNRQTTFDDRDEEDA